MTPVCIQCFIDLAPGEVASNPPANSQFRVPNPEAQAACQQDAQCAAAEAADVAGTGAAAPSSAVPVAPGASPSEWCCCWWGGGGVAGGWGYLWGLRRGMWLCFWVV